MSKNKLVIGLFGYGCVGVGLYDVLQKTKSFEASIKKICIKDIHKERPAIDVPFTDQADILLSDPEINVIVELIDDAEAAYQIVTTALRNRKAVVTANKKMIAENFMELWSLQKKYQVPVLYEAACCAGIPIIRSLEEYYDNDMLNSIDGIINGSTNYILTKTIDEQVSYQAALQAAQLEGYAESNPEIDVSGEDAKNKLLILIVHAFGAVLNPEDIFTIGIKQLGEVEIQYALEKGLKIKLVAHAHIKDDNKIAAWVMPTFIDSKEKLYHVDDVYNGVATSTYFSDAQFFVGKGAGSYPTASAVLSDLSALSYGYKYEYKKFERSVNQELEEDVFLKVLLSHKVLYREYYRQFFNHIEEMYQKDEQSYIVGTIALTVLKELYCREYDKISVVLFKQIDAKIYTKEDKRKEEVKLVF